MSRFNRRSIDIILESLNTYNKAVLSEVAIALSEPESININGRNTAITITPTNTRKFIGKRTIFYNRDQLSVRFTALAISPILDDTVLTTHDVLLKIFEQYNVLIEPTEIVLANIDYSTDYTLTAETTAFRWLGSVTLTVETIPEVYDGVLLDDGTSFLLDDGSNLFLDSMIVTG